LCRVRLGDIRALRHLPHEIGLGHRRSLSSPDHTGEQAEKRWPSKAGPRMQHPPLTAGPFPSVSSLIPLVRLEADERGTREAEGCASADSGMARVPRARMIRHEEDSAGNQEGRVEHVAKPWVLAETGLHQRVLTLLYHGC